MLFFILAIISFLSVLLLIHLAVCLPPSCVYLSYQPYLIPPYPQKKCPKARHYFFLSYVLLLLNSKFSFFCLHISSLVLVFMLLSVCVTFYSFLLLPSRLRVALPLRNILLLTFVFLQSLLHHSTCIPFLYILRFFFLVFIYVPFFVNSSS